MSAKVLSFPDGALVGAGVKVSASRVLAGARAAKLTDVVVLGYHEDGRLYAASTEGPGDALWTIESGKLWPLEGCPEQ